MVARNEQIKHKKKHLGPTTLNVSFRRNETNRAKKSKQVRTTAEGELDVMMGSCIYGWPKVLIRRVEKAEKGRRVEKIAEKSLHTVHNGGDEEKRQGQKKIKKLGMSDKTNLCNCTILIYDQ